MQLRSHGFIAEIERKIAIDAHAAEGLKLEITKSIIMEDVQYSIDTLKATRAMGITLAHSLNLKVVAEGVETKQELHQLLSLNCDEMQGFLFSKPARAEVFETGFLATPPDG